jgi:hypothetical protein
MIHGFSYREKDPNYNKYEQQFSKETSQTDKTKKKCAKDVLSVINVLFENFLDTDKQTLVQKVATTNQESLKQL